MSVRILHNPRCSKSRQTLQLLQEKGVNPEITEYLAVPLAKDELKDVLRKLGKQPHEILRKNEAIFKEKFKGKELSEDEWIEAMITYPKLMERPIVINGEKAALGRPPEDVLEIL
ncbi:arsenate reductase (glutaredoxin) [bacterium SCSIO 12741]|nr:arsenate reductase (glutaredoxin) [bacterium SCSIO 12741]